MTPGDFESYTKIVGVIVAVLALIKAVYEYTQERKDKRAQQFLELRNYFRNNEKFQNVIEHLYSDKNFSSIPNSVKIEFMAFFEDLALLMSSNRINKKVVFYMFGGDAITAFRNDTFWNEDLRKDKYWGMLSDFVSQMEEINKIYKEYKVDEIFL